MSWTGGRLRRLSRASPRPCNGFCRTGLGGRRYSNVATRQSGSENWQAFSNASYPEPPGCPSAHRPLVRIDPGEQRTDAPRPLSHARMYQLTGAIGSDATTLTAIVAEMEIAQVSERQGRLPVAGG